VAFDIYGCLTHACTIIGELTRDKGPTALYCLPRTVRLLSAVANHGSRYWNDSLGGSCVMLLCTAILSLEEKIRKTQLT
jgi:hypothetical protein